MFCEKKLFNLAAVFVVFRCYTYSELLLEFVQYRPCFRFGCIYFLNFCSFITVSRRLKRLLFSVYFIVFKRIVWRLLFQFILQVQSHTPVRVMRDKMNK